MGRLSKIKKDLIMEANKKLLGEDISDEIDKKISYINYLNTKYEQIGDTIIEFYSDTLKITKKLYEEKLDILEIEKNYFFNKYKEKISIFCKTTKSIKKEIEENLLHNSNKVLDMIHVLEKINENTNTSIVPSNTSIVPSNTSIVPSEEDEYTDYEIVPSEVNYDLEVAEDYGKRLNKTLMAITKVVKNNLSELPNKVQVELIQGCLTDMLSPIFEKTRKLNNLSDYLKMRGNEVNQKINSLHAFNSQTGKRDPKYSQQLDKIIELLDFKKDERLEYYLKNLVKGYDKTDNNDINK